jgi:hypothetical protein
MGTLRNTVCIGNIGQQHDLAEQESSCQRLDHRARQYMKTMLETMDKIQSTNGNHGTGRTRAGVPCECLPRLDRAGDADRKLLSFIHPVLNIP